MAYLHDDGYWTAAKNDAGPADGLSGEVGVRGWGESVAHGVFNSRTTLLMCAVPQFCATVISRSFVAIVSKCSIS